MFTTITCTNILGSFKGTRQYQKLTNVFRVREAPATIILKKTKKKKKKTEIRRGNFSPRKNRSADPQCTIELWNKEFKTLVKKFSLPLSYPSIFQWEQHSTTIRQECDVALARCTFYPPVASTKLTECHGKEKKKVGWYATYFIEIQKCFHNTAYYWWLIKKLINSFHGK